MPARAFVVGHASRSLRVFTDAVDAGGALRALGRRHAIVVAAAVEALERRARNRRPRAASAQPVARARQGQNGAGAGARRAGRPGRVEGAATDPVTRPVQAAAGGALVGAEPVRFRGAVVDRKASAEATGRRAGHARPRTRDVATDAVGAEAAPAIGPSRARGSRLREVAPRPLAGVGRRIRPAVVRRRRRRTVLRGAGAGGRQPLFPAATRRQQSPQADPSCPPHRPTVTYGPFAQTGSDRRFAASLTIQ
jgi:hypothetical protein